MNRHGLYRALTWGMLAASPFVAVMASAPAHATTFAELSLDQMVDAASMVVRGQVLESWSEMDEFGRIWTKSRVRVSTVYKGMDVPAEIVVDQMGGTYRGIILDVPGRAWFSPDEEAILFLNKHESGRIGIVQKYMGKYVVRRAPGDDRPYVRTWSQPQDEAIPYDGRFLPHPAPEQRLYADDLVGRIQARVAAGWDGQPIQGLELETLRTINLPENRIPR